ncbi:MAG TPA: PIN domain-containing protein [Thermoanaerobaculia bacterium]|jgi:predicted nucleic acid-binding protein|nr:PIN domain-containing protein [Thermoanaerobaculia bacterium]
MARRTEAYVDTAALIAFADSSDSHHLLFRRLFSAPPKLVTIPLVIAEGQAWFLKRFDRHRGLQFLSMVESLPLEVIAVGSEELRAAADVVRRFSDQDLTLVDACGLVLMESRRSSVCWSTDFHLRLMGVPLVIDVP